MDDCIVEVIEGKWKCYDDGGGDRLERLRYQYQFRGASRTSLK
jgi:hypothetical protein